MNIKVLSYLIITLLFSICSFAQSNEKESILILSINFYTTTTISVPCENFASQFKNSIIVNKVCSEDSIALLNNFIHKIKFSKKSNVNVNTRAKLIYTNKSGNKIDICIDKFNILINGNLIKKNKLFTKYIFSLIPKEQITFYYPK